MGDYLYSPDVVRVTLVMGVIVSMLFYERVQLTTGGAIVPAYLALALQAPVVVFATVGAGVATHLVMTQLVARRWIVYGRRKFEIEVLVGLGMVTTVLAARLLTDKLTSFDLAVAVIGFLVPGIIAHDMSRQGVEKTLIAIGSTTAILGIFVYSYIMVLPLAGAEVRPPEVLASVLGYDRRMLLFAVALSVVMSMLLFGQLGLRSGGFITAAYIAFIVPRWWDLAFLLVTAFVTWLVVSKLLMPRLLMFGRRKLSTMVLFGALISSTGELAARWLTDGLWEPVRGLTLMTVMLPALIANDAQRQGWERTLWGLALATAGVLAFVNLLTFLLLWLGWLTPHVPGA